MMKEIVHVAQFLSKWEFINNPAEPIALPDFYSGFSNASSALRASSSCSSGEGKGFSAVGSSFPEMTIPVGISSGNRGRSKLSICLTCLPGQFSPGEGGLYRGLFPLSPCRPAGRCRTAAAPPWCRSWQHTSGWPWRRRGLRECGRTFSCWGRTLP